MEECVAAYMDSGIMSHEGDVDLTVHPRAAVRPCRCSQRVRLLDKDDNVKDRFGCGEPSEDRIHFRTGCQSQISSVWDRVDDWTGSRIFSLTTYFSDSELPSLERACRVSCQIDELPLAPGRYNMSFSVGNAHSPLIDALDNAISFDVDSVDYYGNGRSPEASYGRILVRSRWESNQL